MPERIDRCVESLMKDPNFKPKKPGQDKRSAAFALCTWLDQQGRLRETSDGVKITMEKAEMTLTGPFKIVLPLIGARRQIVEKAEKEEVQLWLHCEASGPEIDRDGDRFSEAGLAKMVKYAQKNPLNFLDGHYRDLLAALLGSIVQPYLTEQKHFAFDVLLNSDNPFAIQLFNDILAGKRHGASIAGIVHNAEIEEYGENGEFGRIFHDVELLEVSRTSWPSYRDSFITLLANKVGKLPQEELDQIIQRREEVIKIMSKTEETMENDMIVRNEDESVEVWGENENDELVLKIVAPHGWDKKFTVSNKAWSAVKDRSKPCQFCIIKKNDDGSFSSSKSGYPHHLPGCNTIVRGGISAAAGRLVQALKSGMPDLEIPPIISMAIEALGAEEFEAYEEKGSRFTAAELKYAAQHIVKHYRRDLGAEPPESLVGKAETYEDEQQEIIELTKNLVRIIGTYETDKEEEIEMSDKGVAPAAVEETPVVETPVVETAPKEEPAVEQEVETVTETVVETPPVEQEVKQSEVVGETQAEILIKEASSRPQEETFARLFFRTQEKVGKAVGEKDLAAAHSAIDAFAVAGKNVVSELISTGLTVDCKRFLAPWVEVTEMATGQLAQSRVDSIVVEGKNFAKHILEYVQKVENINAIDDSKIVAVAEKAEMAEKIATEVSREAAELRGEVEEKSKARSEELRKMAEALTEPEREEIALLETDEKPIEITKDMELDQIKDKWLSGLK